MNAPFKVLSDAQMRPNPFLLIDRDSPSWSEPGHDLCEAARIRGIIDTFARARSYWSVMRFLSGGSSIKFFLLAEALTEVRADFAKDPTDQNHARVAVAEHFQNWRNWL